MLMFQYLDSGARLEHRCSPEPSISLAFLPSSTLDLSDNMSLVDSIVHVMTPAEWGKPIDVDEKWIDFVDDNVKASTHFVTTPETSYGRLLRVGQSFLRVLSSIV